MARPASDIPERLLSAARHHFLVSGVDGASLRKIAADADTSIGMIHYHYKTKDALFLAVVEQFYERFVADLAGALDPASDVETRLRRFFERFGALSDDELDVVRLVLREALVSNERLRSIVARFQRGHLPLLLAAIFEGCASGLFDERRSPFAMIAAVGTLSLLPQVVRRRLPAAEVLPFELPSPAALAEEMVAILFDGIRKTPGS